MPPVMLALLLAGLPQVAVVDISAPDAVYEDVSRAFAQALANGLSAQGVVAVRIDESELPPGGCRLGPCLGVLARARGAVAIVTVDAEEASKGPIRVVATAMRATNGEPLAGGRWTMKEGQAALPKAGRAFLGRVQAAVAKLSPPPATDAGTR